MPADSLSILLLDLEIYLIPNKPQFVAVFKHKRVSGRESNIH